MGSLRSPDLQASPYLNGEPTLVLCDFRITSEEPVLSSLLGSDYLSDLSDLGSKPVQDWMRDWKFDRRSKVLGLHFGYRQPPIS